MAGYKENYQVWANALKGTEYAAELALLQENEKQCADAFYTDMEFGTAGMRGIIGMGLNRMNVFTVRRATQALANHINAASEASRGVAIAYDTREKSDLFAQNTAGVLLANGIKVYMYSTPHSVPQLSFAILELGCAAGVVITASHNPAAYNGYKVYGCDGGQLSVADSNNITKNIAHIDNMFEITPAPLQGELFNSIGDQLDELYFSKVEALCLNQDILCQQAEYFNIVYTPLHGTGLKPVTRVLADIGVKQLHIVAEQREPDPAFPTVSAPNPENREAFDLAILLADKTNADLILATDPDSDRLGVAVRDDSGEFIILTGNQIGCILMDYQLSQVERTGDEFVVKSLVSTDMADVIANHYGVELRSVYTGFKYIAEQIKLSEATGKGTFRFGFEESYGYLFGQFVRDKDAIQAAMKVTEAAAYYAAQGKTLFEALNGLFVKYGWFRELVLSQTLSGQEGLAKIKNAVEKLREKIPTVIGDFKVKAVRDYLKQTYTVLETGHTEPLPMDSMNVLYFELEIGSFIIRPSGTEPKLKSYLSVSADSKEAVEKQLSKLQESVSALLEKLLA